MRKYRDIRSNLSMYGMLRDFGNRHFSIRFDESHVLFTIGNRFESVNRSFDSESEKGGIIVFSTDVNAVKQSDNKIIDWVTKKWKTLRNRLLKGGMLDKVADRNDVSAMTVGKFLQGRYKSNNGSVFTENSVSVEVLGVDDKTLFQMAEDICKDFDQECVLVKSYKDGGIYFVDLN